MSEQVPPQPDKRTRRAAARGKLYAATSSLGYSAAGAALLPYPGVAPKVLGAVLALKGADDYLEAYDSKAPLFRDTRDRVRQRFESFVDIWKQDEGTSIASRLRRQTADEAINFRDKEYRTRFNRLMGGMMGALAGVAIHDVGPHTTASNIMAAGMVAAGVTEHMYNTHMTFERTNEMQAEAAKAAHEQTTAGELQITLQTPRSIQ